MRRRYGSMGKKPGYSDNKENKTIQSNLPNMAISDEAVKARTGKVWKQWFSILDSAGAKKMGHQDIVSYVADNYPKTSDWYQEMIAVTYEQDRGLRLKHQNPEGFQVSVSKTIYLPATRLFDSIADDEFRIGWVKQK